MNKLITAVLVLIFTIPAASQTTSRQSFIESLNGQNAWVDSVFENLSRHDRVAQLFMVRAHTNRGKAYSDSVGNVIKREHLGGVVFFQGGPGRQAAVTNQYQQFSKVPLMVAMDGEWGVGMRLIDSTISYPYQMTLGAIQDNSLIYEMGRQVAKDFKRLGMHINFAPDVDVNNNPKNPVINFRSFGENKLNVAAKGEAYMRGLQDGGILVSLKHFPGHGDTDVDSHYDLPQLPFTRGRLDSLEMFPFRQLINKGASGVMVAHMNIPALDKVPKIPSTLSKPIITGVLKNDLGFKGLIFTDAMDMKGVVKYFPGGEADLRSLLAGADVIELSENSARAIKLIRKAIRNKRITWERIEYSVKKILAAKYWAGLNNRQQVITSNLYAEMNRPEALALNQRLADAAVTVLKSDSLLKAIDFNKRTALVSVGTSDMTTFQKELMPKFKNSLTFIMSKNATTQDIVNVNEELAGYEQIIVGVHDTRLRPQSVLDYSNELKLFIAELTRMNSVISVFANPYTIAGLPGLENSKTLMVNYQQSDELQIAAAKVITRQIKASGTLPVTINTFFKYGDGLKQTENFVKN